jgi:FlaA1/EpsC-like NDP-sugar epimerase
MPTVRLISQGSTHPVRTVRASNMRIRLLDVPTTSALAQILPVLLLALMVEVRRTEIHRRLFVLLWLLFVMSLVASRAGNGAGSGHAGRKRGHRTPATEPVTSRWEQMGNVRWMSRPRPGDRTLCG